MINTPRIESIGSTVVDFDLARSPANTSSGRIVASIDPIEVGLAMRSLKVAKQAMEAQFYRGSIFQALG